MSVIKLFAIGLGFKADECMYYEKAFLHTEENNNAVIDFLQILSNECIITQKITENLIINLQSVNLKHLAHVFKEAKHEGTANFLSEASESGYDTPFICIMTTNDIPKNIEEAYLILHLFSEGKLNALNQEHRHPLTKIFASLPTINMSNSGFTDEIGAHDKFLSWLLFNNPGTNRFAPTSFARYGAHFGKGNTLMFSATVNIGVSIGDDNLLDGHCSIASCVQIGNRNKIGSFVSMEGVLSPVNENPVIVGDDNFFGTRCRLGTGLVIGNNNFWGSGVDLSLGTPLRELRDDNIKNFGNYVKAGSKNGIQGQNETMIVINNSRRQISGVELFPGEYLLFNNSLENQTRFERNEDLTTNN